MQKSGTACSSLLLREMETATVVVCGLYCTETAAMEAVQRRMETFNANIHRHCDFYLLVCVNTAPSKEILRYLRLFLFKRHVVSVS